MVINKVRETIVKETMRKRAATGRFGYPFCVSINIKCTDNATI